MGRARRQPTVGRGNASRSHYAGNAQLRGFDPVRRRTNSLAERAGRRRSPRLVRRNRVFGLRADGFAGRPGGKRADACTVRTVFGLGKSDAEDLSYRTRLAAGATFETPTVFLGCYDGEVDDGSNRLRRWVERHLRPPCEANLPLLVNNSWGDGMAVDEALMRRMIDSSARLGMEMVGVDAGWYRQVGDWRPDLKKFPSGMAALADHAPRQEPAFWPVARLDARGRRVRSGPAWQVAQPARSGHAGLVSHRLPAELEELRLHRGDRLPGRTEGGPVVSWRPVPRSRRVPGGHVGTRPGDDRRAMRPPGASPHRLADRRGLPRRARLLSRAGRAAEAISETAPGGLLQRRELVDYGILRRTHYVSITDVYDPVSNRRAFFDSSYAMPPAMCECYVENRPGKTPANFVYMLRSGLMGWCTVMTDMTRWTPAQQAAAQREFTFTRRPCGP